MNTDVFYRTHLILSLAELSMRISAWMSMRISAWISEKITDVRVESSVQPRISIVNFFHSTDIQADIHADIGGTDIVARFTTDIRGSTDNLTRISVLLRISKRIFARKVRPGIDTTFKSRQGNPSRN